MQGAEWLEERRKGIGASDVAAILGVSPWKTAFQVYQGKRKEVKDWEGSSATDWGLRMEPALRQWYSDITGRSVRLPDKILYHKDHPFMLASLDGYTDDNRVIEIKTARYGTKWGEPGTDQIPEYYMTQVQHQMFVTGFSVADVVVSIGGGTPEIYEISEDKELQGLILEACTEFWQRVQEGNPPSIITFADAVARFGKSTSEGVVYAPVEAIAIRDEMRSIRIGIKSLEAKDEELQGKLIVMMGDKGDILVDSNGGEVCTYKLMKGRKTLNVKAIEKQEPEIYIKYLKVGEPSRRFTLK